MASAIGSTLGGSGFFSGLGSSFGFSATFGGSGFFLDLLFFHLGLRWR